MNGAADLATGEASTACTSTSMEGKIVAIPFVSTYEVAGRALTRARLGR